MASQFRWLLLLWTAWWCSAAPAQGATPLPYRFLLVISAQWQDPASYVIEGNGEFPMTVSLLKSWGLPFEILRLDQQRLDRYHLLERDGKSRYGTIIWDAGPGNFKESGAELVGSLVKDQGIGLVILGDSVAAPEFSDLAGVHYSSEYKLPYGLEIRQDHFITRTMRGRESEFGRGYPPGSKVEAEGATVLISRGALPFLTVRQFHSGGRVAWLGADRASAQIGRQIVRDLFKRCLVWTQGYALYHEYPKSILLEMHDMGASDKTFLAYWHYRNLTEEQIRASVIEPLKRHNAVLNLMVNTGYVDRKTERVLNPWKQEHVVDALDTSVIHNYASLKRGLDDGVREGVFEVECHGWTHMLPDLDSPPGPFWTAPLDGVATLGWDNEFGDRIRKKEIPAITQRVHMQRALECLKVDFGVRPLFLRPGGGEFSPSYADHTARIAAEMGFGLTRLASPYYLGHDFVIALKALSQQTWSYERRLRASDIPWSVDGPYFLAFHDKDVAMDSGAVERLLTGLGEGVHYFTADEYIAYLHASVSSGDAGGPGLALAVSYDDHYCRYFESHPSTWTLQLSDDLLGALKIEGWKEQMVKIPKGLGRHIVRVNPGSMTATTTLQ